MKSIVIKPENEDKINLEISKIEGKATVRCINYDDISATVKDVEKKLSIIPKKYWEGITIDADPYAQDFANAYKFAPMSTHFVAVRTTTSWRLTEITRTFCRAYNHEVKLTLTEAAKYALIAAHESFRF